MPATGTGSEVFTTQLANALSRRGIETVITRYPKQTEAMPFLLGTYRPPARTDAVHLNAGSARNFLRYGIPGVITAHGAFEQPVYDGYKSLPQKIYHSMLVRPGIRQAVSKASAITAVSRWVADVYRRDYGAQKIDVVHNWVSGSVFSPVIRKQTRKLLFAGRPVWQKGSHLLPKLSALLGDDFELTCTLRGSEWPGNVPANVRLIGPVAQEQMPGLYQAHDALVVPSIAEGFCLAAIEAMASGLPVFGFRGHGLDDALGPLADTCGASMQDIEELANSVRHVFGDPRLYRDISEQSRVRVQTEFSEEMAVGKYLSLYQKIIA